MVETSPRHDWTTDDALALLERPFHDLLFDAQQVHRAGFRPDVVEGAILLSIKTGACPEDSAYCPQSEMRDTGLAPERQTGTEAPAAPAPTPLPGGGPRFSMDAA